jgi:5-methyltetrahydropteroyltriglutamate--homocysteine methyltransferase
MISDSPHESFKPVPMRSQALLIITFAEVVGQENVIAGTDCGLGGRVHPQIAWAKLRALRDGAAIASKKLWS